MRNIALLVFVLTLPPMTGCSDGDERFSKVDPPPSQEADMDSELDAGQDDMNSEPDMDSEPDMESEPDAGPDPNPDMDSEPDADPEPEPNWVFVNLPASISDSRGADAAFEIQVQSDTQTNFELDVVSTTCSFDIGLAGNLLSWTCAADAPETCNIEVGIRDSAARSTLEIICENAAPSVSNVEVSPSSPGPFDTLECLYDFSDPDADEDRSSVRWYVGLKEVGVGKTLVGVHRPGESLHCEVEASDLWDIGAVDVSGTVIIADPTLSAITSPSLSSTPIMAYSGAVLGDTLYFRGEHPNMGTELWKMAPGQNAQLVKDVSPAGNGVLHDGPVAFGDHVYFAGNDGIHGNELWRSDGTLQGTQMVADLSPGLANSDPRDIIVFNNQLYFYTGSGLWRLDASNIPTLVTGANTAGARVVDGRLYFVNNNVHRLTQNDTIEVLTNFGSGTEITRFVVEGGNIYFMKGDGLYISNGVPGGTTLMNYTEIADFMFHEGSLYVLEKGPSINGLVFTLTKDGQYVRQFWTMNNTSRAGFIGSTPNGIVFYATGSTGSLFDVWKSDGTNAGTVTIKSQLYVERDWEVGDHALFSARPTNTQKMSLWRSDGTSAGTNPIAGRTFGNAFQGPEVHPTGSDTALVRYGSMEVAYLDLVSNTYRSLIGESFNGPEATRAVEAGDHVFFTGYSPAGSPRLHKWNPLQDTFSSLTVPAHPEFMASVGNRVAFGGFGITDLWFSDGTPAGSYSVRPSNGYSDSVKALLSTGTQVFYSTRYAAVSSGTVQTTHYISQRSPPSEQFVQIGADVYYISEGNIYKTQGGLQDEQRVSFGQEMLGLLEFNGELFYWSRQLSRDRIGKFNLNTWGLQELAILPQNVKISRWVFGGGSLFFVTSPSGTGDSIWRFDPAAGLIELTHGQAVPEVRDLVGTTSGAIVRLGRKWGSGESWLWGAGPQSTALELLTPSPQPRATKILSAGRFGVAEVQGPSGIHLMITDSTAQGTSELISVNGSLLNIRPLGIADGGLLLSAFSPLTGSGIWNVE